MLPAAITGKLVDQVAALLEPGDTIIDGGNSYYRDDIERAARLAPTGVHYLDVGTSGGVFGLERGFCLMIGGDTGAVERLDPIFRHARSRRGLGRAARRAVRPAAPPRTATSTAGRPAPATS